MCHGITDRQIENAVRHESVGNIRDLKKHLGVGSQCGTCIDMAVSIIDQTIMDNSLFKDVG
jgi:bacterioferritin-associated ferredoxin